MRDEMERLRETGSETCEAVRKNVERAFDNLKKGVDEIIERIRKAA